ncbi:MAG TPA: DUF484 family protein [Leucothrix sp.]|nr:DUF484 family protein [Leucothrix sp.]
MTSPASNNKVGKNKNVEDGSNMPDAIMVDAMMDESIIVDYLSTHPDFFQRHANLLETLQVPHGTGTVSLIERQIAVLREKSRDLEEQLNGLIRTARGNEQIVTRLQRFTLELMRAGSIDDVIASCHDVLRDDFNADFVTLKLIGNKNSIHFISAKNQELKQFDKLLDSKQPVCGRLKLEQQEFFFKGNTDKVNSVALIPLSGVKKIGFLALGSENEARFHPGMGTVFIRHLGELISTSLSRYL